ncbi:hypothetical protein [Delftia sp. GW456-R20]|uniref:hypothetical protein n=1 Tax=Delftia sp. GW456-R20 TaxID=1827145 RepID=UPI000AF008A0|nr:hypothetical protein [Delftia sp. GW456-R20]
MKNKTIAIAVIFFSTIFIAGCGESKQEELAAKQLQDRDEAQKNKAEGEKALTSKKGFNPF